MMYPEAAAQNREETSHLRQALIVLLQIGDAVGVDGVHHQLLVLVQEVHAVHVVDELIALLLGEGKDNHGVVILLHHHPDNLVNIAVRSVLSTSLPAAAAAVVVPVRLAMRGATGREPVLRGRDGVDRLEEVILPKLSLLVHAQVDTVPSRREDVVLQGRRAEIRVHQVARMLVKLHNPLRELLRVGNGCREERVAHPAREQRDGLLPHHASVRVAHVVNLVEDDPSHLAHHLSALVEHRAEHLGGHHQARGVLVYDGVAGHEADVLELLVQLAEFLIGERLERRGVHDALTVAERHGDGVLRDHRLTRGGVRGDHDGLARLHHLDGLALEGVQLELIVLRGVVRVVSPRVRVGCPSLGVNHVVQASVAGAGGGDARATRREDSLDVRLWPRRGGVLGPVRGDSGGGRVGVGGDARRRRRARLRLGALRDVVGGQRCGRPGGRLTLSAGADRHRVKRVWRGRGGGVPHPRRRPSTTAAVRCRSMLVLGGQGESQTVGPT